MARKNVKTAPIHSATHLVPQCCSESRLRELVQKGAEDHLGDPAWGIQRPDGTWVVVQHCPFCGAMLK